MERPDAVSDGVFAVCELCARRCELGVGLPGPCHAVTATSEGVVPAARHRNFRVRVVAAEATGFLRFYPGRAVLSVRSGGSGLDRPAEPPPHASTAFSPEQAIFLARSWDCQGVVLSTDDPVFCAYEGAEILAAAHDAGIGTAIMTSGYVLPETWDLLFARVNMVGFRLWSISPEHYRRKFDADLSVVLATLRWLKARPPLALEVFVPVATGENDAPEDVARLARFVLEELGPGVPVHLVSGAPTTLIASLDIAAAAARGAGLVEVHVPVGVERRGHQPLGVEAAFG